MSDDSIRKEAKRIMDDFMNSMKDIKVEEDFVLIRDECFREEGDGQEIDEDFRQRFLSNASNTKGDFILANKGDWN